MTKDHSAKAKRAYVRQHLLDDAFAQVDVAQLELHRFKKGEYLCRAGEKLEFFHIVVEGRCNVLPFSESGKEFLMESLLPLSFSGDIELFNNCEALHSVRAAAPVAALAIPRKTFFEDMMKSPPFLQMLCKNFASKIHASSKRHSSNMLYPTKNRLSRILLAAGKEQGGHSIQLKMGETAQTLGISSRHLRRVLKGFEESGIVARSQRKLLLLDIKALQKQADSF